MGINHQVIGQLPEVSVDLQATCGIMITTVQTDSPADKAGLLEGDIITGIDGKPFIVAVEKVQDQFKELLLLHSPGDVMKLHVLRQLVEQNLLINGKKNDEDIFLKSVKSFTDSLPSGDKLSYSLSKSWVVLEIVMTLGIRNEFSLPPLPGIREYDLGKAILHEAARYLTVWEPWVVEVTNRYKMNEEYADLRERLRKIESGNDGSRLPAMAEIHRNPPFLERYGRAFSDKIMQIDKEDLPEAMLSPDLAMFLTGNSVELTSSQTKPLPSVMGVDGGNRKLTEDDFRIWYEEQMRILVTNFDQVYSVFTPEERAFFVSNRFGLTEIFAEMIYINSDPDKARLQNNLRILEFGSKINLDSLFYAGKQVCGFLAQNEDKIFSWMKSNPKVKSLETKFGKIGFGSSEHDRWADPEIRYIFDPGGNDFYADGAGTAMSFDQPIAWIIDKHGDDAYQSTSEGAQGSGLPGIGILIDRSGDDTYIGSRMAQGTGFLGIGILQDEEGNDNYHGTEFIQGSGLFGSGMLIDLEGDDMYFGTIHAQGVGFTNGLGLLYDVDGDDFGYCTGKLPTNYGDAGIFDAWAQGCGMGFRGIASGGIGLLLDGGGEDKWEAGNFSQGGGYYYGFGIFRAGGNDDDKYIGSRYAQGFCAHQAAGLFIEDGGDDYYTTRQGVATGLAWDECVTVFVDESGDDTYYGGTGFSHGASAHNSICIFLDGEGRDSYFYKPGPARAGGNDYHGGTSFSLFVDSGREIDTYTSEKAKNNVEFAWPEYGVFRDGKGVAENVEGKLGE